jgi:hypothetical protein
MVKGRARRAHRAILRPMNESDVAEARVLVELLRSDEGARACYVAMWGDKGRAELAELDATTSYRADPCSCASDSDTCRCLRAITGAPGASLDDLVAATRAPKVPSTASSTSRPRAFPATRTDTRFAAAHSIRAAARPRSTSRATRSARARPTKPRSGSATSRRHDAEAARSADRRVIREAVCRPGRTRPARDGARRRPPPVERTASRSRTPTLHGRDDDLEAAFGNALETTGGERGRNRPDAGSGKVAQLRCSAKGDD